MKRHITLLVFYLLAIFSCTNKNREHKHIKLPIEKISVNITNGVIVGAFDDFFKNSKLVVLQTNKESLVGTIKRIAVFNEKFFILNKETNNILIFDTAGRFLNKIGKVGNGAGTYNSLTDFAINDKENTISLYADRPYKLLTYKLDGQFIKEEPFDALYHNIAYDGNSLIFLNRDSDLDYNAFVRQPNDSRMDGFLPMKKSDKLFQNYSISNPYIVKSKKPYIFYPYCDTVYTVVDNQILPKYVIDFGKDAMPKDIFDRHLSAKNLFDLATNKHYGYRITNFRESDDFITFSYNLNKVVVYSKKLHTAKTFDVVINKDNLPLVNYFAHDGNDNNFISMISAYDFKYQMDLFQAIDTAWKKVPPYLKQLNASLTVTSNPMIVLSTLK